MKTICIKDVFCFFLIKTTITSLFNPNSTKVFEEINLQTRGLSSTLVWPHLHHSVSELITFALIWVTKTREIPDVRSHRFTMKKTPTRASLCTPHHSAILYSIYKVICSLADKHQWSLSRALRCCRWSYTEAERQRDVQWEKDTQKVRQR